MDYGLCDAPFRRNWENRNLFLMVIYALDLFGVAVFAVSGALAAGRAGLDLFGVVVIAALTAIGGGTLRDLLLNRHPIFWIRDPRYLVVVCVAALSTVGYVRFGPVPGGTLLVADALGLGMFAMAGAGIAETAGVSPVIVVLMGTLTGTGGGILRDVLTARIPLILQKDIYATAAIAGIALYLALQAFGIRRRPALGVGVAAIVLLRLAAIYWGLGLPVFQLPA